jgi:hypothetical protein
MSKTRSSALKRDREQKKAEKTEQKRRRREERKAEQEQGRTDFETTDAASDVATESEFLAQPSISEPDSTQT